jgi:RimJ/RimL family protein N-acetyltransferase
MKFDLQPTLEGKLVRLRPLHPDDLEALYAVASDPLVWEQHPRKDRYQRPVFGAFFKLAMESKGAFLVLSAQTGEVLGSSRFCNLDPSVDVVEIGYTFLARSCWGKGHNPEMKKLMLEHAFKFVNAVHFYIGECNIRSQTAIQKIGARFHNRIERVSAAGTMDPTLVFRMDRP